MKVGVKSLKVRQGVASDLLESCQTDRDESLIKDCEWAESYKGKDKLKRRWKLEANT